MARPSSDHEHEHEHDHDHEQAHADPATDRMHHNSWSANLEKPQHAEDRELVVEQAIAAIQHTTNGHHVNLVTHGDHGHPSEFLYSRLEEVPIDRTIAWEYVEQCGCGGHVTRVRVHEAVATE